jgi:hypothetical protein
MSKLLQRGERMDYDLFRGPSRAPSTLVPNVPRSICRHRHGNALHDPENTGHETMVDLHCQIGIRIRPAPSGVPVVPRQGFASSHAGRRHRNLRSDAGSHPSHAGCGRRLRDLADARTGSWLWWPNALGSKSERSRPGCSRGSLGRGLPGHARAWRGYRSRSRRGGPDLAIQ